MELNLFAQIADLELVARTPRAPLRRHPMRSAWWLVPFAACLSDEWWLRRRQGKR